MSFDQLCWNIRVSCARSHTGCLSAYFNITAIILLLQHLLFWWICCSYIIKHRPCGITVYYYQMASQKRKPSSSLPLFGQSSHRAFHRAGSSALNSLHTAGNQDAKQSCVTACVINVLSAWVLNQFPIPNWRNRIHGVFFNKRMCCYPFPQTKY